MTIHMNGCTYLFHGEEGGEAGTFLSNVDLVCPAGSDVVLNFEGTANCTVTVPAFTGNKAVVNTNQATSPKTVKSLSEVKMTANGSGGICGGTGQIMVYKGTTILKAFSAVTQVDLEAVAGP